MTAERISAAPAGARRLPDERIDGVVAALRAASRPGPPWREQMRAALATLLLELDAEPDLARAWAAGEPARDEVVRIDAALLAAMEAAAGDSEAWDPHGPAAGEWVLQALRDVVSARLQGEPRPRLAELAEPLTALVALPFLGVWAVTQELARHAPPPPPRAPAPHPPAA
jgi:hypothetical protein